MADISLLTCIVRIAKKLLTKDLKNFVGKKWFAFSKFDMNAIEILGKLKWNCGDDYELYICD